jgi:hypothetical protein
MLPPKFKMKNKKVHKRSIVRDSLILIGLPVIAATLAVIFKLNFLITTIIFFGAPALYLSLRNPHNIRRGLIFASCFSLAGIYTDYMAERDLAWAEPSSVFNFRIGGLVPVESIVWFFLLSYLIVTYYSYFFDHSTHRVAGKRMKFLYLILVLASVVFYVPLLLNQTIPTISYFYLKLGLALGLLPLIAFCFELPRFIGIFLKTAPYFFALSLLNEFVGLHNGHWMFPGRHFIGWVHLGGYSLPIEEVLFWMVMFSSAVIAYFEFFDDNRLRFKRPIAWLKGF